MLERVKHWVATGVTVRIMTARVSGLGMEVVIAEGVIQDWLEGHGLPRLSVTCRKDYQMYELWDDRAIQVIPNTGKRADGQFE